MGDPGGSFALGEGEHRTIQGRALCTPSSHPFDSYAGVDKAWTGTSPSNRDHLCRKSSQGVSNAWGSTSTPANPLTKFVAPRTTQSKHYSGGIYCRHTSTAIESWRNTKPATTPLCLQFAGLAKLLLMPEARSIKCKVPREMTGL